MKISVEISLYPLSKEYGPSILNFIDNLNKYNEISVSTNTMSTQIFGAYDQVMDILKKEMLKTFKEDKTSIMVMKIVNEDLS